MATNCRNKFDKRESLEIGRKAELCFVDIMLQRGNSIREATSKENKYDHIDYYVTDKNLVETSFDVKSQGRCKDDEIWLQLHGVYKNNDGWLFAGKAKAIAFERKDCFYLVKRENLVKLVKNLIDEDSATIYDRSLALYSKYSRLTQFELLTLIKLSDLQSIPHKKIEKKILIKEIKIC